MKILFKQIGYLTGLLARNLFWLYKNASIKCGTGARIAWPFQVEGRGKIEFGNQVNIGKRVKIGCGTGGKVSLADQVMLSEQVTISVRDGVSPSLGERSQIEQFTRLYVQNNWQIGNNVAIATYCQLFAREPNCYGRLQVGNGTHIGDFSIMDVSGDIIIGENTAIGPRCTLYTHDHDYRERGLDAPWKGSPVVKPIIIEDGAWIGSNVTILPGVTIGEKAIIAAGAVVTVNIPAGVLAGGVPAKIIKQLA